MTNTILIVDDEQSIGTLLQKYFQAKGFNVKTASDGATGISICQSTPIDLVLLDLRLPDLSGLEVLKNIKSVSPNPGVIILTAHGDVETAVKAMQMKADNFVLKPVDLATLEALVNKTLESCRNQAEIQYLKRRVSRLEGAPNLANMPLPQEVFHAVRLLAENSSTNVLVMGETGTGKGMVAAIVHELSDRREFPFMDINCAGLSGELLESELFGHERGAFTDAVTFKKGLLEVANGGSVFLDEIGELSLSVQAKLLKVIEQKKFRRLGATSSVEVDVRIIAATNCNLAEAIKAKTFREDLYYRLNVMPISLPPLRERRNEILPLAGLFREEFNKTFHKAIARYSPEAEALLLAYSWPGNIRELKNIVERTVLLCDDDTVRPAHLPTKFQAGPPVHQPSSHEDWTLDGMERKHIEEVLFLCNNNHSRAAKVLGIHRSTLIKKISKYRL
jgi:two-component system, NtrC family, response regulator AtoC